MTTKMNTITEIYAKQIGKLTNIMSLLLFNVLMNSALRRSLNHKTANAFRFVTLN